MFKLVTASFCVAPRCILIALAFSVFLLPANRVQAFRFGSTYDVVFNAFVVGPDGESGVEGHVMNNLVFDGLPDMLPLNSAFPVSIGGYDLQTMEVMSLMSESEAARPGMVEPIKILIESLDGGDLVMNEFQEGAFGRVSLSITDLVWDHGDQSEAVLKNLSLRLIDASGNERFTETAGAISGAGTLLSPWRVYYSLDSQEFGENIQKVEVSFDAIVVPEPLALPFLACGIAGLLASRRRTFGRIS